MTDIPLPRENTGVSAASSLRANLAERLAELAADPLSWIGVAAVAFGIAVRAWMISGPMGTPDMDAATVAAQANAFLDGHLGVFFLNQAYGGTLEVGVVAAAFGIGGPNVAMLTLVPMVLHAAAALLCWRVARRVTADRLARFLVPCFVWTFPAGMVLTSIKERGFYGATVVLAALSMLLALRIAQEGAMRIDVVGLGLVAGLGWWTTPLLAPVAFASGVWVLARSDRARRQIPALAGAAMLGAAPWLVWNFMNGWASLGGGRMPGLGWSDGASSWLHSLGLLSGTATPWDAQRNLIPWWLAAIVVGAVVVVAWLRTRREVGWLIPGIVLVIETRVHLIDAAAQDEIGPQLVTHRRAPAGIGIIIPATIARFRQRMGTEGRIDEIAAQDHPAQIIAHGNEGDLWLGTHQNGVYKFNGTNFEKFR